MSTGVRVPLDQARRVAVELATILALGCERIRIAGSIRRRRPDVGDIELVAVPRFAELADGLFETRRQSELDILVDTLLLQGTLATHPTDPKRGERYAKLVHRASGLQVDLFTARPETFGLILLIRTGPAAFSQELVTEARRRGLHVANGELHRGSLGCGSRRCEVIPTPQEADVFAAMGMAYILPAERA